MLKKSFKRVPCPFNSNHIVSEDRLITHIVKCMKNYPNHFTCPFNASHRFLLESDFKQHILTCPEKRYTFVDSHIKRNVPLHVEVPKCEDEESWDD